MSQPQIDVIALTKEAKVNDRNRILSGGNKSGFKGNRPQRPGESRCIVVGNTNPSGKGMNGNCYFSEGINPSVTCNKNEGNRIAIPVIDAGRINKTQNGRRLKEDGDESFTLTGQDRHGVAIGPIETNGYNATLKAGGELRRQHSPSMPEITKACPGAIR